MLAPEKVYPEGIVSLRPLASVIRVIKRFGTRGQQIWSAAAQLCRRLMSRRALSTGTRIDCRYPLNRFGDGATMDAPSGIFAGPQVSPNRTSAQPATRDITFELPSVLIFRGFDGSFFPSAVVYTCMDECTDVHFNSARNRSVPLMRTDRLLHLPWHPLIPKLSPLSRRIPFAIQLQFFSEARCFGLKGPGFRSLTRLIR